MYLQTAKFPIYYNLDSGRAQEAIPRRPPPDVMGAATGGCCTPGALSLVLFKESVPDPERKSACYRIPRPRSHTAGYRIVQGRTDMRFRATQLGRRLQRGHTLQRRCYVAAHSTQGTSRTSPDVRGAAEGGCCTPGALCVVASCTSFASGQARSLSRFAAPPLPRSAECTSWVPKTALRGFPKLRFVVADCFSTLKSGAKWRYRYTDIQINI